MTQSGLLAGIAVSLFLSIGTLCAATPASPPIPPAQSAPADPFTQDLLRRLTSTNEQERQAAKKQLAAIAQLFDQTDAMQQLGEVTADIELKSLFQERVNQIKAKEEEKRLTNLPLLTLNLKSASLTDVVDAINRALNSTTKLTAVNTVRPEAATFNLDVKDKPFWQVIAMLQDQQPLELMSNGTNSMRLSSAPSASIRRYAIDGPCMAWVTNINYSRSLNYRTTGEAAVQPQMPIQLTVAIDPRIRATQFKTLRVTSAVDDEGHIYRANIPSGYTSSSSTNFFNQQLIVIPPEHLGKTLSLSLDGAATTTVGDPVVTIDDIQKNVGKQVTIGGRTVRITSFSTPTASIGQLQLSADAPNAEQARVDEAGILRDVVNMRINYSISDATGRTVTTSSVGTGSSSSTVPLQSTTPPYKLELRTTGRPIEIHVHLELKGLPLP